ncbi:nitroreductase [Paenibacillus sp. WLX1005]|uniref:nitroreductase n=1 Tax=Paenibacillus sp. WLX1005 TaxID=3243766 RepID=UPI0039844194
MMNTITPSTFSELMRKRKSIRQFQSMPVPEHVLHEALEDAQYAPSNCNTQPWHVHIVSGAKKDELSQALLHDVVQGHASPDFEFDFNLYHGRYAQRQIEQVTLFYQSLGITREDREQRQRALTHNFEFYDAPHVAFLFMPSFGDNVRVASDVGMYGQSLLLALAARGIGSIPQTSIAMYADTVRRVLNVPQDLKLLFGISFGYADEEQPVNQSHIGRDPVKDAVTFH